MKWSIDMIRLQVRVFSFDFDKFLKSHLIDNVFVTHYIGFKFNEYHDNFKINEFIKDKNPFDLQDCYNNFWVGFNHNSEKENLRHNLVIEFNPNKCDYSLGLLNLFLINFFYDFNKIYVIVILLKNRNYIKVRIS